MGSVAFSKEWLATKASEPIMIMKELIESERKLFELDRHTVTGNTNPHHYSISFKPDKKPEDNYIEGSTRRFRGYFEVVRLPDYQMNDQGGEGLQGFTYPFGRSEKVYTRASRTGEAGEYAVRHEIEHRLRPHASEHDVRVATNTTNSNPHFSYTVRWSG